METNERGRRLTHGSLFSGIGGFELGASLAGIDTLWSCEIEPFQRRVLRSRFPKSELYGDITKTGGLPRVDIVSGGFPCQDISLAGKGVGIGGGRSGLWGEMFRIGGRLDPTTSSLRTLQPSLFGGLSESYATFPQSGMTLNGSVYRTAPLVSPTAGRGFTLLPTPTKSDCKAVFRSMDSLRRYLGGGHQRRIMDELSLRGFSRSESADIIEAAMGFPAGHTELGR